MATNIIALLSSMPLTMRNATLSGVLVALGQCRTGCPQPVAEAAQQLHLLLQQPAPSSGVAAQQSANPALKAPQATVSGPAKAQQAFVLDDQGQIVGLDEAVLASMPAEVVRTSC